MDDKDILAIIAGSPWFKGLPRSALEQLAAGAVLETFPVNTYLYSQGEPTTKIYCIVSGRARLSISSAHGHEFALVDREAGTWLGEPGLVNDEARILDARTIEPSSVLVIPREEVLRVGEEYPLMYRNLFCYHQGILRDFHELMAGILFYPLRARVAGRLLHLVRKHGVAVSDGIMIDIKVSQNDFARLALGSRQRVNKIFRDWSARGIVQTRDDHLVVRSIQELEGETEPFE
jgi:CRP-like cAMP-binding protein